MSVLQTKFYARLSSAKDTIASYKRHLNSAQANYTTAELELLSIVETLKEFRNLLLGQKIKIYTDFKNLAYKTFFMEEVMQWRLSLEEYSPELIYIQGSNNIVLCRLDIVGTPSLFEVSIESVNEHSRLEDEVISHPTNYNTVRQYQQKDKELIIFSQNNKDYSIQNLHGTDKKYFLIC